MHGLSPFSNKFAIKFLQNCTCLRGLVNGDIKNGSTEFCGLSSFRIIFCVVLLLMCNFQCVLLVDFSCTNVLVCLCSNFLTYVYLLLMLVTLFLNQ